MVAPANPGDFDIMMSRHWTRTAIDSFDGGTLVISDLHLGDRSGADDFAPNEPLLQAFLEEVAPRARRVILNGDIFELWQTDLEPILFAYPRLIATLVELARQVEVRRWWSSLTARRQPDGNPVGWTLRTDRPYHR
ncbi:MAG: hypothetical protein ACM3VX_07065 [Bacteroidota bacterium]